MESNMEKVNTYKQMALLKLAIGNANNFLLMENKYIFFLYFRILKFIYKFREDGARIKWLEGSEAEHLNVPPKEL